MALKARWKPALLPSKLLRIREALGLSQGEMLKRLGIERDFHRQTISAYERGELEPPLPVILLYAQVAGISTDLLIDDELPLPKKLPANFKR